MQPWWVGEGAKQSLWQRVQALGDRGVVLSPTAGEVSQGSVPLQMDNSRARASTIAGCCWEGQVLWANLAGGGEGASEKTGYRPAWDSKPSS